jgi:hypothetical protein
VSNCAHPWFFPFLFLSPFDFLFLRICFASSFPNPGQFGFNFGSSMFLPPFFCHDSVFGFFGSGLASLGFGTSDFRLSRPAFFAALRATFNRSAARLGLTRRGFFGLICVINDASV